jgi:hypothetical protein
VDADTERLDRLRTEARYTRQRRDLYRAKSYGPRATSPERMRELERAADQAAELLAEAERAASAATRRGSDG